MTVQADLLYMKSTGHVLSAFTRVGEPKDLEKDATLFAGEGLPANGLGNPGTAPFTDFNTRTLVIPPEQINLFRGDIDPHLLLQPRNLCLTDLDASPNVQPIGNAAATVPAPGGAPPALTITIPAAATSDIPVIIVVEGPNLQDPLVISTKIAATQASVSESFSTLGSGQYYVVVFIAKYPIAVRPFTV